jgi:hypothetical protein
VKVNNRLVFALHCVMHLRQELLELVVAEPLVEVCYEVDEDFGERFGIGDEAQDWVGDQLPCLRVVVEVSLLQPQVPALLLCQMVHQCYYFQVVLVWLKFRQLADPLLQGLKVQLPAHKGNVTTKDVIGTLFIDD